MEGGNPPPPGSGNPQDKRKHPRLQVKLGVEYSDGESSEKAVTNDMSEGGAFVVTPKPPPVGTSIKLNIRVPGEDLEGDQVEAKVVRVVQVDGDPIPDHITGMGLEFKLTAEQRERLRRMLMRHGSGRIETPPAPEGGAPPKVEPAPPRNGPTSQVVPAAPAISKPATVTPAAPKVAPAAPKPSPSPHTDPKNTGKP